MLKINRVDKLLALPTYVFINDRIIPTWQKIHIIIAQLDIGEESGGVECWC